MMDLIANYGLFLAQTFTLVAAVLILVAGVAAITRKKTGSGQLHVKPLNKHFQRLCRKVNQAVLSRKALKAWQKERKAADKQAAKNDRPRVFVINFKGDVRAQAGDSLRQEVSAILSGATQEDHVVINLESPGGMVSGYGLCASQLQRIKDAGIPLTVCVDKVAASGGYLMACVADTIIAAPFAIIGSIGVVAQFPNFHRFLKKRDIDFETITAGEYKRTMTMFGENSDSARKKFTDDLEDIHEDFKAFVAQHRPQISIEEVATGEHWLATKALTLGLVDQCQTSDDYLMTLCATHDIYTVRYQLKESTLSKMSHAIENRLLGGERVI